MYSERGGVSRVRGKEIFTAKIHFEASQGSFLITFVL